MAVLRIKLNHAIPILILAIILASVIGVSQSIDLNNLDFSDIIDSLEQNKPTDIRKAPEAGYDDEPVPWNQTSDVFIDMFSDCVEVSDGDTIRIASGDFIRLADIQAPELGEVGYAQSRNELTRLLLGNRVYLDVDDVKDIYGRYVCVVYLEKGTGFTNINHYMAENSYASHWEIANQFDSSTWRSTEKIDLSYSVDAELFSTSDEYVGDKKKNIYHVSGCPIVIQITYLNEHWFGSAEEAEAAGFQACSICLSPEIIDEGEENQPTSDIYVAGEGSITFHYLWCHYVDQISEEDKVYFNEKYEAIDSGRRACQSCNP